ncbi:hypothetical protein PSQ90_06280 [Devosia rhodophyticola]|uniref:SURF1-like protein n=1 Tax=Devosia rhodophyticola TaxID=3026423 RepID=A0ABY7Z0A0_9HYPH|nr:hypothetical protein [Devosia rhodophyticola]WDR07041.1 hypothetical protein PSQ90_06280 [Devosia rhodophyticola]
MAVDPLGRIAAQLPVQQMDVLDVVPDERLATTIFAQYRYWPLLIALLFGLGISVAVGRRQKRVS